MMAEVTFFSVDVVNPGVIALKPGDKVEIQLSLKDFKRLQDDDVYGGWEDPMEEVRLRKSSV
jgi:hypothetical protein